MLGRSALVSLSLTQRISGWWFQRVFFVFHPYLGLWPTCRWFFWDACPVEQLGIREVAATCPPWTLGNSTNIWWDNQQIAVCWLLRFKYPFFYGQFFRLCTGHQVWEATRFRGVKHRLFLLGICVLNRLPREYFHYKSVEMHVQEGNHLVAPTWVRWFISRITRMTSRVMAKNRFTYTDVYIYI